MLLKWEERGRHLVKDRPHTTVYNRENKIFFSFTSRNWLIVLIDLVHVLVEKSAKIHMFDAKRKTIIAE